MAVPFWIKFAASELIRYKLISSVRIHGRYMAVLYKSGLRDKYYFSGKPLKGAFKVEESDLKMGSLIPVEKAYEVNPMDPIEQKECAHHLHIDKKHLEAGSFIDGRLAIHLFIARLMRTKLVLDRYPDRSVSKWAKNLQAFNYDKMISKDAFNFYKYVGFKLPWRQVLWQFFPPSLDYTPRKIETILASGINQHIPYLDTTLVIKRLLRYIHGHTLNPLAYCAILKKLGVSTVIDLHPERGYKAVACGLLGIHYIYRACNEMDFALNRRIVNILDLSCEPLDNQRADILLSDGHFESFDIDGVAPHLDHVNTMLAYVPRTDRLRLMAERKPTRTIKVLCRYVQGRNFKQTAEDPDFIFIW